MFFQKYFRWIVIALPALLYFGSVWQRPLYLETEFRQAEIARETATTFPVPSLNGELLPGTPPLVHWCNAAVMRAIGEQPAAVRLIAALATLLTAGVIRLLGKRSGIPRLGEAAALIWLFCGAVYTAGTRGGGDALFVLFNTVTLATFFLAATETAPRRRIGFLVLCGVGWAAAILCRGGEALLTAAVPAVVLLLWRREEWRGLLTLPWIPLLVAALLVAGCAAACRVAPAVWLLPGGDSAPGSPVAGLLLPLAGLLPWILFLPMVWHGYRIDPEGARRIPLFRFACCLLLTVPAALCFSNEDAAFRLLPCLPGAAILFAIGMLRASDRGDYWWVNRVLNLLVWGLLPIPLLLFVLQTLAKFTRRIPAELVLYRFNENYYLPVLALMVVVIWFRMAAREPRGAHKFGDFCVGMAFFLLAAPISIPWRFVRDFAPEAFLRQVAVPRAKSEAVVLADPPLMPAAAWTLKRTGIGTLPEKVDAAGIAEISGGRELLFITGDEARVRRLPASRTTWRAGGLFVVYYPKSSGGAK